MAKRIRTDDFTAAVMQELNGYSNEVMEIVNQTIEEITNESLKALKTAGDFNGGTDYKRSWSIDKTMSSNRNNINSIIHNKDHYQLTHLLENGHAVMMGTGRKTKRATNSRTFVHIGPINDKAQKDFEERLKRALKNG